mgnify:CR=1 FL=1|tara:strand:- start:38144 stop:46864 length:8721 start_codon:yes stop_codon:yes gene_type:complete
MVETRIHISSVVEGQLPEFVREEYPLVVEFLNQYYLSLESQGGTTDILQNIDQYIKVDNLTNLTESTTLGADITSFDSTIIVGSTYGFADRYGLIKIDDEIITYTGKTTTSFTGCVRGFSGVTSYQSKTSSDQLVFVESNSADHTFGSNVQNLSILFLKEFFNKVKRQITPGFQDREFYSGLNEKLFIKQSKDFYSTKGTDTSFEILFRALYGQDVEVVKPRDFLIQPSDAQYSISKNIIVEAIEGNPLELENKTLYQDSTDFFSKARGTIIHAEKIRRGDKDYYALNLDYSSAKDIDLRGTVFGKFSIHPKTKVVTSVSVGSSVIDVDSTIGFPSSGTLTLTLNNESKLFITYNSKTINQFFNCTNIDQTIPTGQEIALDAYAYGYSDIGTSNIIKVRIAGVLSDLQIPNTNHYYSNGDKISIKTLGKSILDYKFNNWFFNISTKFDVISIEFLNSSTYKVNLYDNHKFSIGDSITLFSSIGEEKTGNITFINDTNSFTIQGQGSLNTSLSYTIRKNILKADSKNYPQLKIFSTNVQNVYTDFTNSLYVASSSLPSYLNQQLDIRDRSITFNGTFNGTDLNVGNSHGFYTGDSVVYDGDIISRGIYFVKKIDDNVIKIARSRANIDNGNFVFVSGTITKGKFAHSDFCFDNLNSQLLESQKLIRKLSIPQNDGNEYETNPGPIGIFINGVELLNYKSKDNIYYGPIENIIPTVSGFNYDIINPPILTINDSVGTGASVHCSVIGGLERIDIIDPGFDYVEEPVITITGGNGTGASAKTTLVSFDYSLDFNSQANSGLVNLSNNTIGFSSYHKFRDVEEVIYNTNGGTAIAGLTTNSSYFVSIQDGYTVKLYNSFDDANFNINVINLTEYGTGNHTLKSKVKKKKIGSITVENSGINYQNKKTTITSVGIDTAADIINIKNHGYLSGEIISYTPLSTPIGGLTTSSYYVTSLNENQFKLSQIGFGTVGVSTEVSDFYYRTKQYINLTSTGSGDHTFNYPPITVNITGRIGVSTLTNQNFNAVLQPIFRGQIKSVFIENGGNFYGSQEIINYNKQPQFLLNSGSGAQVTPVISNGKIVDILINSTGSSYNSIPTLSITGDGQGSILTPILSNGTLISVKVISGGIGYTAEKTFITVLSAGEGANFASQVKSWKINLVQRLIENKQITNDDGILDDGINSSLGLEYTHAYAPRSLRKSVLASKLQDGVTLYVPDLQIINNIESNSTAHSPIIGWAYDGYPIYGPYAYSSITGGSVRYMVSGYSQSSTNPYRPSTSLYPLGFFVEDYEYTANGDLDEFNGRFCVTPEYPNGIYAYFCTINDSVDINGSFQNYKKPIFPYIIGNYFKSKPIDFNFSTFSNQDDVDFKSLKLLRNITPYNLTNKKSGYEYLLNPNKIKNQLSEVKNITSGVVESVGIITGGNEYQIGDEIIFDDTNNSGTSTTAKISLIGGKEISQISVASSIISNIEFVPSKDTNNFIGFATLPHNLLDNDIVTITTQYENKKSSNILVKSNILNLASGIGSAAYTGIVTYVNVSGSLDYPNIKENDIYQIQNEQIKVLNIDNLNSRIRVIRNYNSTSGLTTYTSGITITEKTRKFELNFGISSTSYEYNLNREFYFNPKESVGLGTTVGVGIVSTIYFSNSGAGITNLTIPTQTIYLPEHKLNTGDSLVYSSNGGTALSISINGISSFTLLDKSIVYAAKISNDLIGISTLRVGIGSIGSFVGIGTTTAGLLYFTGIGTGVYHSFTTKYQNILVGQVSKNVVTVSTASTHGLTTNDSVLVDVKSGISTTISVKYNDYNRRLVVNPRIFLSVDVDIPTNTITIPNHRYNQGQKIIHTSSSPSGGLVDEKIYYIVVIDSNRIQLSENLYATKKIIPDVVSITSASFGTISEINPPLKLFAYQTVNFDLSDSSLSFKQNSITYSAFDFNFYTDSQFRNKFSSTSESSSFEVSKTGSIGISTNAKVTLQISRNIPINLFYKLEPINLQNNTSIKKEIIIDDEQANNNQLSILLSGYYGSHKVVAISTNSFNYNLFDTPEKSSYLYSEGILNYYTTSPTAFGNISLIAVNSSGSKYSVLPKINSITTKNGKNAILIANSQSIGNIIKKQILDIGFDYSSDYTIRPTARLPVIAKIDPMYTFESIGITSLGKNYYIAPNLVVLDGLTNKLVTDVDLKYEIGNNQVKILQNTRSLNNSSPKIIPINNVNGVGINSISFVPLSKDVVVTLGASFSNASDFPFAVGDKVLIENVSVGVGSTGKGYNSDKYNYSLFTLTFMDPNIGGSGATVVYNMSNYLLDSEVPGNYDSVNSVGKIIPEKYFPIFNSILKIDIFYENEKVTSSFGGSGKVQSWDDKNGYLKIISTDDFFFGETIKGESSGAQGIIGNVSEYDCIYDVQESSIVRNGWKKETGFLSNNLQRIHDNDYYQYFSYSLKSKIPYDIWQNPVNNLNHTAGFKKFSDLIVESRSETFSGLSTVQNLGDFSGIADLYRFIDLNCVNDFDLAKEVTINIDNKIKSGEIVFNSVFIQDYIESIGNKVLTIDDISENFRSNQRLTPFSVVDIFKLDTARSKKYILYVTDTTFVGERQVSLLTLLYNNDYGFLNQYGTTFSNYNMGFFDFIIRGDEGNLLYYPSKSEVNNFIVDYVSYDMQDTLSGVGSIDLGNIVKVGSSTTSLSSGVSTATKIVGIASTYRSSKVLVQIGAADGSYYQYDELTIIHDGINANLLEYGQLSTDILNSFSSSGLGTYNAYLSGPNLNIDFTPNSSLTVQHNVSTIQVSISNTSSVGVGTSTINNSSLSSNYVSIASSISPIQNIISIYDNQLYNSSYYIVSVEDTTNNRYQVSEVLVVDDYGSYGNAYITEFGTIKTNLSLGTISADISGTKTNLYFTPISGISVQVRVFQHSLGLPNIDIKDTSIIF